jgi:hypothetical protein
MQDAVGIAVVRDVAVTRPHLEAGRAHVDQKRGHELAAASRRLLLARGSEQNHEIRMIDMTDEMLGAVDDEVVALLHGGGLHAAQIGTGLRLAHGQTLDPLTAHGGQQVALALLALGRPAVCSRVGPRSCSAGCSWCVRAPFRTGSS